MVCNGQIYFLDLAAEMEATGAAICSDNWKIRDGQKMELEFIAPFGMDYPLCAANSASLKLNLLNLNGRIWSMFDNAEAALSFA